MAIDTNIYEYGGIGRYIFGVNSTELVGGEAKKLTDDHMSWYSGAISYLVEPADRNCRTSDN